MVRMFTIRENFFEVAYIFHVSSAPYFLGIEWKRHPRYIDRMRWDRREGREKGWESSWGGGGKEGKESLERERGPENSQHLIVGPAKSESHSSPSSVYSWPPIGHSLGTVHTSGRFLKRSRSHLTRSLCSEKRAIVRCGLKRLRNLFLSFHPPLWYLYGCHRQSRALEASGYFHL